MIYEIFFFVVSYDIWFYLSHILLHQSYFYKMIHKLHHEVDYRKIKYTDAYVGHFIEGPFQGLGVLVPFMFMDMNYHHIHILFISLIIINIRGMLRHDNRWIWLIGNHHILHHKYPQYNYGEYWLDYIFGTNGKIPNWNEYQKGLIYF